MPKIIRVPLYKRIHCRYCGTVYEYELGDKIEVVTKEAQDVLHYNDIIVVMELMECPTCGRHNELVRRGKINDEIC